MWISMSFIYGLMMLGWWNGMMFTLCQGGCLRNYIWLTFFFIWHLHCISFIALAYGVMSRTYGSDRTGTSSFIGHNDAASYLVGYEGRRHDIALHCIYIMIWDMRCVFWSMALGVIGWRWSVSKDWWWLILFFIRLYYLIWYVLVPLWCTCIGNLNRCIMNL